MEQSLQPHHVSLSCSGLRPPTLLQPQVGGSKSRSSPGQGMKPKPDTSQAQRLHSLGAIHPGRAGSLPGAQTLPATVQVTGEGLPLPPSQKLGVDLRRKSEHVISACLLLSKCHTAQLHV